VHTVYLDEYFISRYPVTNAEYKGFVDATKHRAPEHWKNGAIPPHKEKHPVVCVNWEDTVVYCEWAGMRLPTEAEWEKAASWDETKNAKYKYPWSDTFDASKCNSSESQIGDTTSVGMYSPQGDSSYGATDMAGDVWEWCADWYAEDYYKNSPAQNPVGPDSGEYRVLRGGAWYNESNYVRAASRGRYYPRNQNYDVGFRVVVRPL
jgi:formylglycine-generating enzyme required for sulfatase activity